MFFKICNKTEFTVTRKEVKFGTEIKEKQDNHHIFSVLLNDFSMAFT